MKKILNKFSFTFNVWRKKRSTTEMFSKWKMSFSAILFGLLLGGVYLSIKGVNPFEFYINSIINPFTNSFKVSSLWYAFSLFALSAAAIAVSFKSGMFNIGVSGQLLLSQAMIIFIAHNYHVHWTLLLIVGIITGALVATLSGVLKALFNVHEVVSTILMNWAILYAVQAMFAPGSSMIGNTGSISILESNTMLLDTSNQFIKNKWIIPLIITISVFVILGVTYNLTKYGYSLKITGANLNSAKLSGVNPKFYQILGMTISGAIAGVLGTIMCLSANSFSPPDVLPAEGFEGFAIVLIAFTNLIAIVPVAFGWAVLNLGMQNVQSVFYGTELGGGTEEILNGLLIYSMAMAVVFLKIKPIVFGQKLYFMWKSSKYKNLRKSYLQSRKKIKSDIKKFYLELKSSGFNKKYKDILKKNKDDIKKIFKEYKLSLSKSKGLNNESKLRLEYIENESKMRNTQSIELKKFLHDSPKNSIDQSKIELLQLKKNYLIEVNILKEEYFNTGKAKLKKELIAKQIEMEEEFQEKIADSVYYLYSKDTDKTAIRKEVRKLKSELNNKISSLVDSYKKSILRFKKGGKNND